MFHHYTDVPDQSPSHHKPGLVRSSSERPAPSEIPLRIQALKRAASERGINASPVPLALRLSSMPLQLSSSSLTLGPLSAPLRNAHHHHHQNPHHHHHHHHHKRRSLDREEQQQLARQKYLERSDDHDDFAAVIARSPISGLEDELLLVRLDPEEVYEMETMMAAATNDGSIGYREGYDDDDDDYDDEDGDRDREVDDESDESEGIRDQAIVETAWRAGVAAARRRSSARQSRAASPSGSSCFPIRC